MQIIELPGDRSEAEAEGHARSAAIPNCMLYLYDRTMKKRFVREAPAREAVLVQAQLLPDVPVPGTQQCVRLPLQYVFGTVRNYESVRHQAR